MLDMVELDIGKLAPNLYRKSLKDRIGELLNLIKEEEETIMTQYTFNFLCYLYDISQITMRNILAKEGISYNSKRKQYIKKLIEDNPEWSPKYLEDNYMVSHQVSAKIKKELRYG